MNFHFSLTLFSLSIYQQFFWLYFIYTTWVEINVVILLYRKAYYVFIIRNNIVIFTWKLNRWIIVLSNITSIKSTIMDFIEIICAFRSHCYKFTIDSAKVTEVDHHCEHSAIQGLLGPSTIITRYELRVGPGIYMFDRPVFELFEKRQTLV